MHGGFKQGVAVMTLGVLALGLSVFIVALLIELMIIRRKLEGVERHLTHLVNVGIANAEHEGAFEGDRPELDPECTTGNKLPLPLRQEFADGREWTLIIALIDGCSSCLSIRSSLSKYYEDLNQLNILIISDSAASGIPGVPLVIAHRRYLSGAPFCLMVDSSWVIQGEGEVSSAEGVLEFVSEGARHGFGPGISPNEF